MYVFQKYVHLFWIPFILIGKTAVSQCSHCKLVLKLKEMTPALKVIYEQAKSKNKMPIWTYSGLLLLALAITIGVIDNSKKDAKNAVLILPLVQEMCLK